MNITYTSDDIHDMVSEIESLHRKSVETLNALRVQLKGADLNSSETSALSLIEISKLILQKNQDAENKVQFLIKLTQRAKELEAEEVADDGPSTTQTTFRNTYQPYMATLEDPYQQYQQPVDLLDEEYQQRPST